MKERVRYGLRAVPGESALTLALDNETFARLNKHQPKLPAVLDYLHRQKILSRDRSDKVTVLAFDLARIGRRRSSELKSLDLMGTLAVTAALGNRYNLDKLSPNLALAVDTARDPSGRLGLTIRARWPKHSSDADLQSQATQAMRTTAIDLQYGRLTGQPKSDYDVFVRSLVYADVRRHFGVTLETNPVGSCSADTVGSRYQPAEPVYMLRGENLYGADQVLVCMAGAIALAEPTRLALQA